MTATAGEIGDVQAEEDSSAEIDEDVEDEDDDEDEDDVEDEEKVRAMSFSSVERALLGNDAMPRCIAAYDSAKGLLFDDKEDEEERIIDAAALTNWDNLAIRRSTAVTLTTWLDEDGDVSDEDDDPDDVDIIVEEEGEDVVVDIPCPWLSAERLVSFFGEAGHGAWSE